MKINIIDRTILLFEGQEVYEKKIYYIIIAFILLIISVILIFSFIIYKKNIEISELRKNIPYEKKLHPIEVAAQKCMEKENYTTLAMEDCVYASINDWDKEINKYMISLKKVLPEETYKSLEKSQNKWKAYEIAQSKVIREILSKKEGSIFHNIISETIAEIVKSRALDLSDLYYYITEY